MDLGGLWRGELSLRRLSVLVRFLPPGSALWAAQTGIEYGYTPTDLFIADVFHALTGEEHPANPRSGATRTSATDRARDVAARLLAQRERLVSQSDS